MKLFSLYDYIITEGHHCFLNVTVDQMDNCNPTDFQVKVNSGNSNEEVKVCLWHIEG